MHNFSSTIPLVPKTEPVSLPRPPTCYDELDFESTWPLDMSAVDGVPMRISRLLHSAKLPTLVQQKKFHHLILPHQNRLLSNAPDRRTLIDSLIVDSSCRTQTTSLSHDEVFDLSQPITNVGLAAAAWSVALREPPNMRFKDADRRQVFKICQWPFLGPWESDTYLIGLAALYSRPSGATVVRGCEITGRGPAQVIAFLTACEATSITVIALDHGIHTPPQPAHTTASGLQLHRLRMQLTALGHQH